MNRKLKRVLSICLIFFLVTSLTLPGKKSAAAIIFDTDAESLEDMVVWVSESSGAHQSATLTTGIVTVNWINETEDDWVEITVSGKSDEVSCTARPPLSCLDIEITTAGEYTFTVTSLSTGQSGTTKVKIISEEFSFAIQPKDTTVECGQIAFFSAYYDNATSYQWHKAEGLWDNGEELTGETSNILSIKTEQEDDSSDNNDVTSSSGDIYYYCEVKVKLAHSGTVTLTSDYAKLTVTQGTEDPNTEDPNTEDPNLELTAKFNVSKFFVKLSLSSGNGEASIYRSTQKDGVYKLKATTSAASYKDKKIKSGKTYYYKVVSGDESSSVVSVKVSAKPKLKKFTAKASGRAIMLSWKYNRADKVAIYANTGNGWYKLGEVKGVKGHCTVNVPSGYSKVSVRIRAINTVKKKNYLSRYSKSISIKT